MDAAEALTAADAEALDAAEDGEGHVDGAGDAGGVSNEQEEEEKKEEDGEGQKEGDEGAPRDVDGEEIAKEEEEEATSPAEDGTKTGEQDPRAKIEDIRYIAIIRTTIFGTHRAPSSSSVSWSSCNSIVFAVVAVLAAFPGIENEEQIPQVGWRSTGWNGFRR